MIHVCGLKHGDWNSDQYFECIRVHLSEFKHVGARELELKDKEGNRIGLGNDKE